MKKNMFLAFGFALLLPVAAEASVSMLINARSNCFDYSTLTMNGGKVLSFTLSPGRYVASIKNNNMSCSNGSLSPGCFITNVILQGTGTSSATWGISVTQNPVVVDVPNSASGQYWAFVGDNGCYNNTGTATLYIQNVN